MLSSMIHTYTRRISLRKRFYTTFGLLFLYVLVVVVASILMNYSIQNRFRLMINRNAVFADLLNAQINIQSSFQEALRTSDQSARHKWFDSNHAIDTTIQKIQAQYDLTRKGHTHLRIIKNMHRYQMRSTAQLLAQSELNPSDYEEISFLTLLYRNMNKEAQGLAVVEYRSNMEGFADYFQTFKRQESIAFILLGLLVLVFGTFVIRSINHVLDNTSALISAAKSFNQGTITEEDFPHSGYLELDEISSSFNVMKHEIHHFIDELKEKSKIEVELHKEQMENEQKDHLLKQAQLDFLRSQINPHFLFNTLNIIGKSTVLQNTERSLELIEAISRIMRYTLEHTASLVTLGEELEIIRAYLFIQQARFSSRLYYELKVHPNVESIKIPPVILQPLVENSIKYGLERSNTKLHIVVSADKTDTSIVLTVKDNGSNLNNTVSAPVPGMGIGLHNLKRRLELRYGRNDLIYRTHKKNGTEVTITIPHSPEDVTC